MQDKSDIITAIVTKIRNAKMQGLVSVVVKNQTFKPEDFGTFCEIIKDYYTHNGFQWDEQFLDEFSLPMFTMDIDRGDCKGGNFTIYNLILRCFVIQQSINGDLE